MKEHPMHTPVNEPWNLIHPQVRMGKARCKSCHACVLCAVMPFDSTIVLNPQPSASGNIRLSVAPDGCLLATLALERPAGESLYTCHFATCVAYRSGWRKEGRKGKPPKSAGGVK